MSNRFGLIAALAAVSVSPIFAVTGKVMFNGKAAKPGVIRMNADPACAKATAGKTIYKDDLIVNANGTLSNVFLYVKEGVKPEMITPAPAEPFVFDQQGCQYVPKVFGVRVNQPVKIVNSDPTLHNVHAISKQDQGFNFGMTRKGETSERKFGKAETMVRIKCDVHGWMNAYVGVLDHSFFAISDDKGEYTFPKLPPGEYTVEAWHEKLGSQTGKLVVTATAAKPLDFTFSAK